MRALFYHFIFEAIRWGYVPDKSSTANSDGRAACYYIFNNRDSGGNLSNVAGIEVPWQVKFIFGTTAFASSSATRKKNAAHYKTSQI